MLSDRLVIDVQASAHGWGNGEKRGLQKLFVTRLHALKSRMSMFVAQLPLALLLSLLPLNLSALGCHSLSLSLCLSLSLLFLAPTTISPEPLLYFHSFHSPRLSFGLSFSSIKYIKHKQIQHATPSPHPSFFCGCVLPPFPSPSFPSSFLVVAPCPWTDSNEGEVAIHKPARREGGERKRYR